MRPGGVIVTKAQHVEPPTTLGDTARTEGRVELILRVAAAAEFIGHGAFGIFGKEGWLPYFGVLGIGESSAWHLMPVQGSIDIGLGLLLLARPMRGPLAFMAFWGLFTATLRPLAGEGIWELVERSYNYGVPLALLLLYGLGSSSQWLKPRHWLARISEVPLLTASRANRFGWGLRFVIGAYLIGHGGLGVFTGKQSLLAEYDSIGLTGLVNDPSTLNTIVGLFEIGLGVVVFAFPANGLLLVVVAWKVATEALYFPVGAAGAGFEVIERAGAYGAPLALLYLKSITRRSTDEPAGTTPAAAEVAGRVSLVDR
jgi:hypothetical protein